MITVLFEFNGQPVKRGDHFADKVSEDGLFVWEDIIRQKTEDIKCKKCGDECHLTIVVGQNGANFGTRPDNPCHIEFYHDVNNALPDLLKMRPRANS